MSGNSNEKKPHGWLFGNNKNKYIAMLLTVLTTMIISCNNGSGSQEDSIYNQIYKVIAEIKLYQSIHYANLYYPVEYDIAVDTGHELAEKVNELIEIGLSDEEAKGWLSNLKFCLAEIKSNYKNLSDEAKEWARPDLFQQGKKALCIKINKACEEVLKYYRIGYCENNCGNINQYDNQIDRGRDVANTYKYETSEYKKTYELKDMLSTINGWIDMCEDTYQQCCNECKKTMKEAYSDRLY